MLLRFLSLAAFAVLPSFALTIHADTVLDGKGGVLHNVTIKVEGSKIVDVKTGSSGPADYNLKGLTLMPGWIDTHVHIGWHFNRQDRADMTKDSPAEYAFNAAGNAYATLMAGFTTMQSLGELRDRDLRDLINLGTLPGPRLLSSFEPLN